MVTATKPRGRRNNSAPPKDEQTAFIDVGVEFGGVSIGDATARLGVRISRQSLDLFKADQAFVGHRLQGRVQLGGHEDASGQKHLVEDLEHYVEGVFDCRRLGVSADQYSIGLTFSLGDIDVAELAKFSKGQGRLVIQQVVALPDSNGSGHAAADEDDEDDE